MYSHLSGVKLVLHEELKIRVDSLAFDHKRDNKWNSLHSYIKLLLEINFDMKMGKKRENDSSWKYIRDAWGRFFSLERIEGKHKMIRGKRKLILERISREKLNLRIILIIIFS